MKNNNTFKEYVAPILVLVCICLVITAALAATYGVAKPIIDTNSKKAADTARAELLPEADAFTAYDGDFTTIGENDKVYVQECYVANNKCGMVVTVNTKSFGGMLTMMVGIDSKGAITGVKVNSHADTPGLGTKNFTDEYLGQYKGIDSLNSTKVKQENNSQLQYISGASVTGSALHYGVYCALDQYKVMGGVQ